MLSARMSGAWGALLAVGALCGVCSPSWGQPAEGSTQLEAVAITGSRIRRVDTADQVPVQILSAKDIERAGIRTIGELLQRLPMGGSALNTQFNEAGGQGFPPDGGGFGAGSTTVSLRHLGAKRTLVLVDGLRWVNESSASGISGAVDLNTIPTSIIERVEVLTDGASALYGSDAIAGVINIITKREQDGGQLTLRAGDHSVGDGAVRAANLSLGGRSDRLSLFVDLSHFEQQRISSSEFGQSSEPIPGTGLANGSSATPTGRFLFNPPDPNDTAGGLCPQVDTNGDDVPDTALCNITPNGTAAGGVPAFPGDFHRFDGGASGDRFNYAPFNLLLTPNQRSAVFTHLQYDIRDNLRLRVRALQHARKSLTESAPEPIFIGPGAGTGGLADTVGIDASNPFNPLGYSLDAGSNLDFAARRPLEGGPRIFQQDVQTRYLSASLSGEWQAQHRLLYWDLQFASSRNRAQQRVQGTYNIAHIARALGPVADCTAPCVPLNFFGGPGSINADQLAYIAYVQQDSSAQSLDLATANLSGELIELPAGPLGFAAGVEHRRLAGEYTPDAIVAAGESNGVPALPSRGSYEVDEAYLELDLPLLADITAAQELAVSLALRHSRYSSFGDTSNGKLGLRWAPISDLLLRATWAEGFRAPSIGELFGAPARFDAVLRDPCSDASDAQTISNCQSLGVPPGPFQQANTQIAIRTGGNAALAPETTESFTLGAIYSPGWITDHSWAERLDFSITYYDHRVDDAIQAPDAQTQLNRCVASLDPAFCNGIGRGRTGDINQFNNGLRNLGRIQTRGLDFGIQWQAPPTVAGQFGVDWNASQVLHYRARATDTGLAEPESVGREVNDSGIHRWRSQLRFNWSQGPYRADWTVRYLSRLNESCADANGFPICDDSARDRNELEAVSYHDLQAGWQLPQGADLSVGVRNLFAQAPPACLSCSLNGYDASNYDLPGRFAYLQLAVDF